MAEVKIKGHDENTNCDRCWLDKEVIVIEFKGETKRFCPECYHEWRAENNIMPNSQIPAFNTLINAFDLIMDLDKLGTLLENLSEEELSILYYHPILKEYDLLP